MAIAEKACERLQRVRFPTRPRTAVIRGLGEIARAQRAGQTRRARALSDALAASCLGEYHLRADAARTLALVDSSESMLDAEGKRRFRAFVAAGDYGATVGCGQALLAHRPRVCTSMPAPRPYVATATPGAQAPAAPGASRVALVPAAKPSPTAPASPAPASPAPASPAPASPITPAAAAPAASPKTPPAAPGVTAAGGEDGDDPDLAASSDGDGDALRHKGFMLQFATGLGFYNASGNDQSVHGLTLPFSLMMGYSILDDRLVVGGGIFFDYAPSPGSDQLPDNSDFKQHILSLGGFAQYHFEPEGGFLLQAFAGFGVLDNNVENSSAPGGPTFFVGGGYDWFLGRSLSVAVLGRLVLAPMFIEDVTFFVIEPTLLASISWH